MGAFEMPAEQHPTRKRRFASLDGLRGAAAVLVVLLHAGTWTNHFSTTNFVKNGYLAVDLFFILSGFVIAANYSTRINSVGDIGRFLIVRIFRLYPLHLATLGFLVAIEFGKLIAIHSFGVVTGNQAPFTAHNSLLALLANLFLVHGLHVFVSETWNGPSWSISCEFAAYITFSFAFLYRLIENPRYVIVGLIVSCASYLVLALQWSSLNVTADWGFVRCLAGFFLGTLAFELTTKPLFSLKIQRLFQVVAALGSLGVMAFATGSSVLLMIPMFALLILTTQSDGGPVARVLLSRPAQFLGRVSYSVYMVHELFVVLLLTLLKRSHAGSVIVDAAGRTVVDLNPWLGDMLAATLLLSTIAAAALTYVYVEEPGRAFGRRLAKFGGPESMSSNGEITLAPVLPHKENHH